MKLTRCLKKGLYFLAVIPVFILVMISLGTDYLGCRAVAFMDWLETEMGVEE